MTRRIDVRADHLFGEELVMTQGMRFGFVVEYVQDMDAARRFYVDLLGLKVEREHPEFIQFDTFAIAKGTPLDGESMQEVYWLVDDAEAAYKELSSRAEISVPLQRVPFGTVFGLLSPDGFSRYVLELAQNRPSRVVK